jgi:hypothetical protein
VETEGGRSQGKRTHQLTFTSASEQGESQQRQRRGGVESGRGGARSGSISVEEELSGEFGLLSPESSSAYLAEQIPEEPIEGVHDMKRIRMGSDIDNNSRSHLFHDERDETRPMFPPFNQSTDFALIAALRADYDERIKQKNKDLEQMAGIIAVLQREHKEQASNNHILKKAVAIQEHRQREIMEQNRLLAEENQKLQYVLHNAASHINTLERENAQLKIQLGGGGSSSSEKAFGDFLPPPPPDVF